MTLAKEVGRSGIEWLYIRGYRVDEIAAVYDVSTGYLYSTIRLLYGAGWRNDLNRKRNLFQMEELKNEKQRISELVCC